MYILYKTWTTVVTLKAQSWTWNYLARPQILPLSRLTVLTQAVNSPGWNKKAQANPFKTITRVGKGTKEWKLKCKKDQCHGLRTVWEWGGLKCRHVRRRNWVWTKASCLLWLMKREIQNKGKRGKNWKTMTNYEKVTWTWLWTESWKTVTWHGVEGRSTDDLIKTEWKHTD